MRLVRLGEKLVVARRLVPIYVLLLVAAGCQQRPTTVSGAITLNGRPLTIATDGRGTVTFQPDGGRGTMSTGMLDSTGHFNLATGSSLEVAPGKYYVTVSVARLLPKSEHEEQGTELITPAKYASARESGLQADVVPGQNRFSFELTSSADERSANVPDSPNETPHSNDVQRAKNPGGKD